ncbi:hypothetical protein Dfri01_53990 [Dyadobacter frigoris]|nr:hypothetical protein Dfri01_53990 [Dyadobacter frigoris]
MLVSSFSLTGKQYKNGLEVSVKTEIKFNKEIREFNIIENDTLQYTLKLKLDDSGRPQYFFRNIFTPVCYTNECKPVHINFYWDLLGNYIRYDLPEGKVLTKVDHEEFKAEDYEKLQDILAKQNSIFADLKMEDLITKGTDELSDSVDAKTGATLKTIKNEVIDGAVYTCFTLWKIAYGKAVAEMLKITESYKNDEMLHAFLADKNYHYQYWAMENVIQKDGRVLKSFEPDIEKIIAGKNLFTARTALQKTGSDFFSKPLKQNWLWETFQSATYPMQIAILKKLSTIPLNQTLTEKIANGLVVSNDEQRKLKLDLLKKQTKLSDKSRKILAGTIDD